MVYTIVDASVKKGTAWMYMCVYSGMDQKMSPVSEEEERMSCPTKSCYGKTASNPAC